MLSHGFFHVMLIVTCVYIYIYVGRYETNKTNKETNTWYVIIHVNVCFKRMKQHRYGKIWALKRKNKTRVFFPFEDYNMVSSSVRKKALSHGADELTKLLGVDLLVIL